MVPSLNGKTRNIEGKMDCDPNALALRPGL
uniref:Uncharacterized protein n=1 Tax=Homo sapiens TaxID=9606 RepID=Q5K4L7_HUMAN|nr:hypothetical protein [Homo sapiens]